MLDSCRVAIIYIYLYIYSDFIPLDASEISRQFYNRHVYINGSKIIGNVEQPALIFFFFFVKA